MSIRRAWDSDDTLLANGFSLVSGVASDDPAICPHCQVEIAGPDGVDIQGDAILCKKCGKPVLDHPVEGDDDSTPQEDEEGVNREEFVAAWGEQFDPEDGDHDYELGD